MGRHLSAHVLSMMLAVAASSPSSGFAQSLEPLPGSPYSVGSTPLAFATDPAGPILFGITPTPAGATIEQYGLSDAFQFQSVFHTSEPIAGAVLNPARDRLYGATHAGVAVFAIWDGLFLSPMQTVSRDGADARPLKGIAYVSVGGGSFVYVNENTFPVNVVATYRVLDGGGLAVEGTIETGDGANFAGGTSPSGIPSTPRIAYAGGRLFVLNGGSARVMGPKVASVSVFDVADDGRLSAVAGSPFFTSVYAQAMIVGPDGRTVYLGTQGVPAASVVSYRVDDRGRLSDAPTWYPPLADPNDGAVDGFALDPSGRWIVATLYTKARFAVVDLESGETTRYDLPPYVGTATDVVFGPTGDTFYIGTTGAPPFGAFVAGYTLAARHEPPQAVCVGAPGDPVVVVAAPGTCGVTIDALQGLAGTCGSGEGEAVSCTFDGAPAEALSLGDHAVSVVATSAFGLSAACTSFLRVVERDPPVLSLAPSPAALWPPNHLMIPVALGLTVEDACDPAPAVVCSASSSEPQLGSAADVSWDGADLSLRAERSGEGPGRTYVISCTATDACGNVGSTAAPVVVPHDVALR